MANSAQFETAPAGTERRNSSSSNWAAASVGDKLEENHESRNTQGQNYQIRLYSNSSIQFAAPALASLINLQGVVKYRSSAEGAWVSVNDSGQYIVAAVGTGRTIRRRWDTGQN
jgi:hypothetical protein